MNGCYPAFLNVGVEPGDIAKFFKQLLGVPNISSCWINEDYRIIRI